MICSSCKTFVLHAEIIEWTTFYSHHKQVCRQRTISHKHTKAIIIKAITRFIGNLQYCWRQELLQEVCRQPVCGIFINALVVVLTVRHTTGVTTENEQTNRQNTFTMVTTCHSALCRKTFAAVTMELVLWWWHRVPRLQRWHRRAFLNRTARLMVMEATLVRLLIGVQRERSYSQAPT